MSEPAQPALNCPFYGRHAALTLLGHGAIPVQSLTFVASPGDQCALGLRAYTPCDLALERKPVDWRVCPVWAANTHPGLGKV